jgi:hypothetical protein
MAIEPRPPPSMARRVRFRDRITRSVGHETFTSRGHDHAAVVVSSDQRVIGFEALSG